MLCKKQFKAVFRKRRIDIAYVALYAVYGILPYLRQYFIDNRRAYANFWV
jgi:hypothetical protein